MSKKEMMYRFVLGGTAVMLSYIVSQILPWKQFGGIFAAFPAVMVVAVMMMGMTKGSAQAAKIAQGAVYGMLGCTICVITVLFFLHFVQLWTVSILMGIVCWFFGAKLIFKLVESLKQRRTRTQQG